MLETVYAVERRLKGTWPWTTMDTRFYSYEADAAAAARNSTEAFTTMEYRVVTFVRSPDHK